MAVSAVKKEAVKPVAGAGDAAAPPPVRKGKRLIVWVTLALLIAGSAGGAYWYFVRGQGADPNEPRQQSVKPPIFVPLDNFTVNLQLEDAPQFLQVGLSLKVADNAAADLIKLHIPEIRDRILLLLSSKKSSQLLTLDGKQKLAAEIVASVNAIIAPAAPMASPKRKPKPKVDENAEGEDPAAGDAEEAAAAEEKSARVTVAPVLPVKSVLFTSFIVQ